LVLLSVSGSAWARPVGRGLASRLETVLELELWMVLLLA
jgi:hypothetical protein